MAGVFFSLWFASLCHGGLQVGFGAGRFRQIVAVCPFREVINFSGLLHNSPAVCWQLPLPVCPGENVRQVTFI